jgi:hypothetical protein
MASVVFESVSERCRSISAVHHLQSIIPSFLYTAVSSSDDMYPSCPELINPLVYGRRSRPER